MANKKTEKIVLGALMKEPLLLSQTEKYSLTIDDFDERLTQHIFYAIASIAAEGSTNIKVQDVHIFLQDSPTGLALFDGQNGVALLNDAIELANEASFNTYYNLLKKENLLRDLKKQGFDTSKFYEENPITREGVQINDKYLDLEIQDIIEEVKLELLGIEKEYLRDDASETQNIFEGLEDLLDELEDSPDIGPPLQGDIFNTVVAGARKGAFYVRSGSSGVSKALPNSTKIPTPKGWTTVGKVKAGDYLFDAFGKPTKVLGVYPQGEKEVYAITFKDGRIAKCCREHLWSFNTTSQKQHSKDARKFYTAELGDIIDNYPLKKKEKYNILVPMQKAVEYPEEEHYIPPYIFGLILGDGSFRQNESNKSFQYSSQDIELVKAIATVMGWTIKKGSKNNFTWYFSFKDKQVNQFDKINIWVEDILKEHTELINTYSQDKFIPEKYLRGSVQQRLDLLNGLLDSDGSMDLKGRISIATTSEKLKDNIIELVQSLGFKATFLTSFRDDSNRLPLHRISIIGSKEQKQQLFKLKRKVDIRDSYINNGKQSEKNTHNAIIKIENLNYKEEMTCFRVDNEEHLFLMNDFIVTHNTRQAVGDACYLAFPLRYNPTKCKWELEGCNEKVLIVVTEQTFREIRTMVLAYLTGMNEKKIKRKQLMTSPEKKILREAVYVLEHYQENLYIVQMPNPTIQAVKTIVRENVLLHHVEYVFYDYIFISPSLLAEFKGFNLRNDEVLLMFSTALKDLAVELDVFVMTSTQTNAQAEDNRDIRNEGSIAGSRAVINKADIGCIMARPTHEELMQLADLINQFGIYEPNVVTDVYKNRGDEWTQIRIWTYVDMGSLRKYDLFLTNARLEAVEDFIIDHFHYELPLEQIADHLTYLNTNRGCDD